MNFSTIEFGTIADTLVNIIVALGALFGGIYGCSKKFRNWINTKLKDTESIKDLDNKQSKLNQRADNFEQHCNQRSEALTKVCNNIQDMLQKLDNKINQLDKTAVDLDQKCKTLDNNIQALDSKIKTLDSTLQKVDTKVEKDKESTILTLKYEIMDICTRANRYKGITDGDKKLLCELYYEYVDVWHENHYVKSEADKIIKTFPILDEYKR